MSELDDLAARIWVTADKLYAPQAGCTAITNQLQEVKQEFVETIGGDLTARLDHAIDVATDLCNMILEAQGEAYERSNQLRPSR